jgi:hypothetical protein
MNNNKSTKKRGRGRPALPKKNVKSNIIPMRLKDEDLRAFTKAAKAKSLSLSEWMRDTLRAATGNGAQSEPKTGRRAITFTQDV